VSCWQKNSWLELALKGLSITEDRRTFSLTVFYSPSSAQAFPGLWISTTSGCRRCAVLTLWHAQNTHRRSTATYPRERLTAVVIPKTRRVYVPEILGGQNSVGGKVSGVAYPLQQQHTMRLKAVTTGKLHTLSGIMYPFGFRV
jgi:hypothetical protein